MSEVVFTFATQEQSNNAVLALSCGYRVRQWFMSVNNTGEPYCVSVQVPSGYINLDGTPLGVKE